MKKIKTLEDALKRIEELEKENIELKEELEYFKKRKASGRQKHNAKWMAIYKDFVACYENGMAMVDIAKRNNISERSLYRYKAYYQKNKSANKGFTDDFLSEPIPQLPLENREELSTDMKVNMLEYKGYKASVIYDEQNKIYTGMVTNIKDVITFSGLSEDELEEEFHKSVEDYIEWAKEGKD